MATMGKYCKAYPIARLRAYPKWSERADQTRKETQTVDGKEVEVPRALGEDDYLYIQETFAVTDGIFLDQNVIFDDVTDEWKEYCHQVLDFDEDGYLTLTAKDEAKPQATATSDVAATATAPAAAAAAVAPVGSAGAA